MEYPMAVKAISGSKAVTGHPYKIPLKKKKGLQRIHFPEPHSTLHHVNDRRVTNLGNVISHNEVTHVFHSTLSPRSLSGASSDILTHLDQQNEQIVKKILWNLLEEADFTPINEVLAMPLPKDLLEAFKNIASRTLLKYASVKPERALLKNELATLLELDQKPLSYFLEVLSDAKTETPQQNKKLFLTRLEKELQALSNIPFKHHALSPFEMAQLCIEAEYALQKGADKTRTVYLRASRENIPRSMAIDYSRKVFTIMSGKYGALNASGGFKKVTDAVQLIRTSPDHVEAKRMARLVNKADAVIDEKELKYEQRYGDIDSIVRYEPKYEDSYTKTAILEEAYDHDMYIFTGYTPEARRKNLPFDELLTVLDLVGKAIAKMHSDGVVHRDVKTKNILYRKGHDGSVEIKLCDFGHTERPKNELTYISKPRRHGTVRHSPPEVVSFTRGEYNPLQLQKALDMYGLGMVIYELFYQRPCPWAHDAYKWLKHGEKESQTASLELQKAIAMELLEESRTRPNSPEKELIKILAKLLEPDPKKRMKIDAYQRDLGSLLESYLSNNMANAP